MDSTKTRPLFISAIDWTQVRIYHTDKCSIYLMRETGIIFPPSHDSGSGCALFAPGHWWRRADGTPFAAHGHSAAGVTADHDGMFSAILNYFHGSS
jgi:hypothetical protein